MDSETIKRYLKMAETTDGVRGALLLLLFPCSSLALCGMAFGWPIWGTFTFTNCSIFVFNYFPPSHRPRIARQLAILAALSVLCFTQSELHQRLPMHNVSFRQQKSSNSSSHYCVCFDSKAIYDMGSKSLYSANLTTTDQKQDHWWNRHREWWSDYPSDVEIKPSDGKKIIEDMVSPANAIQESSKAGSEKIGNGVTTPGTGNGAATSRSETDSSGLQRSGKIGNAAVAGS